MSADQGDRADRSREAARLGEKRIKLVLSAERLTGHRTGVARYLSNLLKEWSGSALPFAQVAVLAPQRLDLSDCFLQVAGGRRLPPLLWEQVWMPLQARRLRADLLFCPSNVMPIFYPGRCALTIHDAIQEEMPETMPFSSRFRRAPLLRWSARRASHVLTDSQASADAIRRYFRVPAERIDIIPLAASARFSPEQSGREEGVRERLELGSDPLVLFVGKLSLRRNVPSLIEAFARLVEEHCLPYRLLLVGINHMRLPVRDLARQLRCEERVHHVEFVPEEDLAVLYRTAQLFVYPSETEGFGLPVLEAMASGTPVITLDRPIFHEVAADAAIFLEAARPELLASAMASLAKDPAARERLRSAGLLRARQFSWTATAARTIEVLARLAGSPA